MQPLSPLLPCAVAAVVALFFVPNLHDPFLSDDYILVSHIRLSWPELISFFTSPGGDGSFRPVGYLYRAVIGEWAGLVAWRWHLSGLLLHLVNCALVYALTFTLWSSRTVSIVGALTFGLHGTRPEVVTWTAGNFDALACCFSMAFLTCSLHPFLRRRPVASCVLVVFFLTLAVWSKESAYAAPLMLAAFAWSRDDLRGTLRLPSTACCALACAALIAHRLLLFGGPGGYVDPNTGRPAILSLSLLGSAKALLLRLWAVLLFPVNWDGGDGFPLAICAGLCGATAVVLALSAYWAPRRVCTGMIFATGCALLPALHRALIGQSELGSRILYLPSVGFCVLCGHCVAARKSRLTRLITASLLVASAATALTYNLRVWHQAAVLADQFCSEVAAGGGTAETAKAPGVVRGVFFFANGLSDCVSMKK
ncbi:MAG TPA: hypothetical protein VKG25_23955 [Bryobacteraceae bacterium]|nr:hypothetical protein [Bryobacteraceae bacterium]